MTMPNLSNERWLLSVCEQRWQRGTVRTLPVPDGDHILTAQGCEDVEPEGEGRFRARVPVDWLKAAQLHKGHATFIEVGRRGIAIDIVGEHPAGAT